MLDTLFFLFKQKTAYEMRISDWSSDVCSSDLLVGVGREGNACSIAAGLHTGGRKPMILIQNTGMLESGDSIRGWLMGLNVPVVLMVGYRGYTRHGVNTDTVATYTEPFINALRLNFYLVESDRSEEHTSEIPSLMRISYAVFCLKK